MEYRSNRSVEPKKRKKKVKKNLIIFIQTLIIIALTVALIVVSLNYNSLKSSVKSNNSSSDLTSQNASSEAEVKVDETKEWYLKLVNPDVSVTNEFISSVKLSNIDSRFTSGNESSKFLDERVVDAFVSMCEAALKDGIALKSISAYRTYNYQNTLYNNRVQRCVNDGLSREEAKQVAATIVAIPGTSEHHLGLAVDINSVEESFEDTTAFRWLQENAEDYGFIMRYSKEKKSITKIIYEPWHYRYVGVEHAKRINELDMCLEEYIDYLKAGNK